VCDTESRIRGIHGFMQSAEVRGIDMDYTKWSVGMDDTTV